ncbi:antitoxin [Candidatus Saccharibacteria bacterium]|nr:antitoxin [Candidatus Saccharibacteria bacterium]NIV71738.1 antitoxin [Calditrichia bacterium]NIW78707.1 antitoxin [Calditrichia bacterium]
MKLDRYEQEIENNISEYQSASDKKRKEIKNIINKAKQKKSVSLRLNRQDLDMLKQKAEKEGIPYQTLIASVLHKYVTDQLVDEKSILKSVQLLKHNG